MPKISKEVQDLITHADDVAGCSLRVNAGRVQRVVSHDLRQTVQSALSG